MPCDEPRFRVGFSGDFLDEKREPIFPDIGLAVLDGESGFEYEFLSDYRPGYDPEQISDYDVLISLKPRVTARSLVGVERLCAVGRCGVGHDNVDLASCTEHDIAVYITPQGSCGPWPNPLCCWCWLCPTIW